MVERFERALREGSAHFAMNTRVENPSAVRARGERRRLRRIVAVAAAVLVLSGTVATAAAMTLPQREQPPGDGRPSPTPSADRSREEPSPSVSGSPRGSSGVQIESCPDSAIDNARVTGGGAAGGNGLTTVTVDYRGEVACRLAGYPTLVGTDGATGKRVTIPAGHGTYFDSDSKRYGVVVQPGQRVSFDIATTGVPVDGEEPTAYADIAILAPHHFEVPISDRGGRPLSRESTTDYDVSRWYLASD